jgi:hypothetical protein
MSVSSGRAKDVASEASDEHPVFSAKTTYTLNDDPLHDEIARILPSVQPGLFPKEICDQLNVKYRSFDSFKTMVHQTLTLMLKQKKLERQSATTQKGGRSHQYIRAGRRGSCRSQSTMNGETESSDVDVAHSYSKTSTTSSEAVLHKYTTVITARAVPATPVLAHMERSSHNAMSVAPAAARAREQTLLRPTVIDSVSIPEIPETQKVTYDHGPTQMAPEASETQAQDSVAGGGQRMQPLTSDTITISSQEVSTPRPAEGQVVQPLTDTQEHSSGRQDLTSRANSCGNQTVSTPGLHGIGIIQAQSSKVECEPPAESSSPLPSSSTNAATAPVASNSPSTPLPQSRPDQAPLTEALVGRGSSLSRKEGQLSSQGGNRDDRSSVSDSVSGICEKTTTSHPSGSCSESFSVQDLTANLVSCVQTPPPAAVADKQVEQGSSAQSQKHATTTDGNRDTILLSDASMWSKRATSPKSQCRPSFTAINPNQQPKVSRRMPSASTQTPLISTSKAMHDIVSRSAPVQSHNTKAHGTTTSKSFRPQARPNMVGTPHPGVKTPKQQSDSSSIAIQQRAVEYPQTKRAQTTIAPDQGCKKRSDIAVSEQNQQDLISSEWVAPGNTRSVDEARKTVTVDLTGISDKPGEIPVSTSMQTNHGNRSALELGNLVKLAWEKGKQRQIYADLARSFDTKRQQAELRLDQLIKEMNDHMENLSGLHRDLEKLHEQVERHEKNVQTIRQQADRTRDTANRVTLECRSNAESKRRAEHEFANIDKELKELAQELDIL